MAWSDVIPLTIDWFDPISATYLVTEDGKYITTEAGDKIVIDVGVTLSDPSWSNVSVA